MKKIFGLDISGNSANKVEHSQKLEIRDQKIQNLQQSYANIVHEFRTPIDAIIGASDKLLHDETRGPLDIAARKYIENIANNADILLKLINDLSDINAINSGQVTVSKKQVHIHEIIVSAVNEMQIQTNEKGITLDYHNENISIKADSVRLKQVLCGLISDSIRFTPPGESIAISCAKMDHVVGICVKDTGIGVPYHEQQYVLSDFYGGENTYRSITNGVGIGMSLSKKIIELHGGSMELVSEPGVGTTVMIYLPLDELEG